METARGLKGSTSPPVHEIISHSPLYFGSSQRYSGTEKLPLGDPYLAEPDRALLGSPKGRFRRGIDLEPQGS